MTQTSGRGGRTWVGFGFGAIQAGLFLYEAHATGAYERLVAAEVAPDVVEAVRRAGGRYAVNIAHTDHIEVAHVGPVQLENPALPQDRTRLVEAIAAAEEIATAVPNVQHYTSDEPHSLHRILAAGLERKLRENKARAVVYAAENHNQAAAILEDSVLAELSPALRDGVRRRVCFVDTVIGKMCGVAADLQGLTPIIPTGERAFLVEAYNQVLLSQIHFEYDEGAPPFDSLLPTFHEKENLTPFAEAKLYGQNALHALAAYLGAMGNVRCIAEVAELPGVMSFLRRALIDEAGAAQLHKYAGVDPFFTPQLYAANANELLARMVNPLLQETVARLGRDPARKLGWNDRLIGVMRMALSAGVVPHRFAIGAAAALRFWQGDVDPSTLYPLWLDNGADRVEMQSISDHINEGGHTLDQWHMAGFPDLEELTQTHRCQWVKS